MDDNPQFTPMLALIRRYAQPGRVDWIGVRRARRAGMDVLNNVMIGLDGLAGDHGVAGKRAVTLMQAEHLAPIGAFMGRGSVRPDQLRRNLVISGLNLAGLKGRRVTIGDAVLEVTTICAPCSWMEEELGPGGYAAVRGHGGWCAGVVASGVVRLADTVRPTDI